MQNKCEGLPIVYIIYAYSMYVINIMWAVPILGMFWLFFLSAQKIIQCRSVRESKS